MNYKVFILGIFLFMSMFSMEVAASVGTIQAIPSSNCLQFRILEMYIYFVILVSAILFILLGIKWLKAESSDEKKRMKKFMIIIGASSLTLVVVGYVAIYFLGHSGMVNIDGLIESGLTPWDYYCGPSYYP